MRRNSIKHTGLNRAERVAGAEEVLLRIAYRVARRQQESKLLSKDSSADESREDCAHRGCGDLSTMRCSGPTQQ